MSLLYFEGSFLFHHLQLSPLVSILQQLLVKLLERLLLRLFDHFFLLDLLIQKLFLQFLILPGPVIVRRILSNHKRNS